MKESNVHDLEKQVEVLAKKLLRSEKSRILIEQAKDRYDMVYRSTIQKLDIQKNLLNSQNQELQEIKDAILLKNHELLLAQKSSELANQAKDQFLANMSHEIRTPLNGVLGFLELLDISGLTGEQAHYLKEANHAAEILLFLINDILDFSKIESGHLTLESIAFDLRQVIDDAILTASPKLIGKAVTMESWIDQQVSSMVLGDPNRLLQIVNNLLSNGVKFTEKGFVNVYVKVVKADETMQLLSLSVKDSGIGLKPDEISRLFKVFTQADPSITRKFGGTGLGLAITQQLVQLMGGEIYAESGETGGAVFTALIPFLKATDTVEIEGDKTRAKSDQPMIVQNLDISILLAEDNETNIHLIELMLKRIGLTCDAVTNGALAVEACKLKSYDVILMDCQMPILDGYEATRLIRSLSNKSSRATIIAMTASAMVGDRERCLQAGMNSYLSKPISGPQFKSLMLSSVEKVQNIKREHQLKTEMDSEIEEIRESVFKLAQELECDSESVQGMIYEFIDQLIPLAKELELLIEDSDTEKALSRLHQLRGVSLNMKLYRVAQIAKRIEDAMIEVNWNQVESAFETFLDYANRLKSAKDQV